MKETEFIIWATEKVEALDPEKLRFAQIPESTKISPVYGDAEFEFSMMDVPGVSFQRIAKFRAARFITSDKGEVVWKWVFDGITRL